MDSPECLACGGEGAFLGALGNREHFRCTSCGIGFSQVAAPRQEEDEDEATLE